MCIRDSNWGAYSEQIHLPEVNVSKIPEGVSYDDAAACLLYTSDAADEEDNNQPNEEQISAQKDIMLKQVLSGDARLRLNNVRMVKPDLAELVENYILNLSVQGKISGQISDDQLKQILSSAQQPKHDFKFNRV